VEMSPVPDSCVIAGVVFEYAAAQNAIASIAACRPASRSIHVRSVALARAKEQTSAEMDLWCTTSFVDSLGIVLPWNNRHSPGCCAFHRDSVRSLPSGQ
jgi:hypothetical protein